MSGDLEEKVIVNSDSIIKTDNNKQIVFTEPKQAPPDPCYCLCCLFCLQACNWFSDGGPAVQYNAHNKRQSKKNYWGHNVTADDNDDDDGIIADDFDWGSMFVNNLIGVKDHSKEKDDNDNDGEGNDDGGDGGGDGGGGDGGGGGE